MADTATTIKRLMAAAGAPADMIEKALLLLYEERAAKLREKVARHRNRKMVTVTEKWLQTVTSLKDNEKCNQKTVTNGYNHIRENNIPPNIPLDSPLRGVGSAEGRGGTKRGMRIDPNFRPPDHDWAKLGAETGLDQAKLELETRKFRDYWAGRAGVGGCKLDWPATWRNWIRNAADRLPSKDNRSEAMKVLDRMEQEARNDRLSRERLRDSSPKIADNRLRTETGGCRTVVGTGPSDADWPTKGSGEETGASDRWDYGQAPAFFAQRR